MPDKEGNRTQAAYILCVACLGKRKNISIEAHDASHAQAQALDISRALRADRFDLYYGKEENKKTKICELFKKLAYSDFSHHECFEWKGPYTNGCPSVYLFNKRFYVRPMILDYMDMNRDSFVKTTCNNKKCVNPYHFSYAHAKAAKLTCGDRKMMLAFASQGVSVQQIAEALNVHRSTVYRTLNNEHLHSGT